MLVCDGAPMVADVGDGGDPLERGATEGGVLLLVLHWEVKTGALVVEEDLNEDLRRDAAGQRERVAAGADRAQHAEHSRHLIINQIESCRIAQGGGWDLSEDVVYK